MKKHVEVSRREPLVPSSEHSGQRVWKEYPVPERKLSLRTPRVLQPGGNGVLPTPDTSHAGPAAQHLEGGSSPAAPRSAAPRPAPGEGAGPRDGEGACLQTRGRERGEGARGTRAGRPGPTGHSPRPLSPIPARPASPGSGSGSRACCSPAAAAAAAAAGSSQGRRRRHRDATPQCISFLTPTGPHCPAACRGGRKGGRAAQDMTPGPRVGEPERRQGRAGGQERGDSGWGAVPGRTGCGLGRRGSGAPLGSAPG